MKNFLVLFFAFMALTTIAISSCKKDDTEPDCKITDMSFSSDILPIFNTNCSTSGCHDVATHKAGMRLDTFPVIKANAAIILAAIKHDTTIAPLPMPYPAGTDKLSDCSISQFEAWISQGAKDN